jgi:DNA-binding transcriptional LysR family regulator
MMARRTHQISLDALRVLDAIARHGSFAAAAQALCVVTSSVTHAVRNLEESLGINLFDRSGRRARFTREGEQLLEKGRLLLAQAAEFDAHAQLVATGWEPRLTLSVDQVIRMAPLVPVMDAFFKVAPMTSLRVRREAAAGSWDALLGGRADLVIGAPAQGPAGGGYESVPLHRMTFVLAVAATHPLARVAGVVSDEELARHRSVVLGDTSRALPNLAVPDTEAKLAAILQGIGCGFLPQALAKRHVREGRLVLLRVETPHPPSESTLAWRAGENGRALKWWVDRLSDAKLAERLFY